MGCSAMSLLFFIISIWGLFNEEYRTFGVSTGFFISWLLIGNVFLCSRPTSDPIVTYYDVNAVFNDDHYLVVVLETKQSPIVLNTKNVNLVKAAKTQPVYVQEQHQRDHYGKLTHRSLSIYVGDDFKEEEDEETSPEDSPSPPVESVDESKWNESR
jgi:hypothetical protein